MAASALLSGCIGSDDKVETKGPAIASEAEAVLTTAETGSLTGAVTSDLFEPLAGARVLLLEPGLETRVAKNGFFTLNDVPPGDYTAGFEADGYQPLSRRIGIAAGEVTQIRVQLIPLAGQEPWAEQIERTGQITQGVNWYLAPPPNNQCVSLSCGGLTGNGVYSSFKVNASEDVKTHVVEVVWTPAGLLGENMQMSYRCPDQGNPCTVGAPGRTSPLLVRRDLIGWDPGENNTNRWAGDWTANIATSWGLLGTGELAGVDIGLAYEQKFTWYITLFHHEPAPEGFSSIPDQ